MPSWLPPLFNVSPWDHNTYDLLYKIFRKDFIIDKTLYCNKHVSFSREIEDGKEKIFWHITTRDETSSGQRLPDFRRCERIPWLKPMLENSTNSQVLAWENIEGNGIIKIYVWLRDHDYLTIMKKTKKGYLILLTAYWLEYKNSREKLLKKYNYTKDKKANA